MKKFVISLFVVALTGSWQIASAGDVSGKVTLKGAPLPEKPLPFDTDVNCGPLTHAVKTTRYYVVGKDNGLANVFVYISKGLEGKKFTAPSDGGGDQSRGCMYYPYVSGGHGRAGREIQKLRSVHAQYSYACPPCEPETRNLTSLNRARAMSTIPSGPPASPSRKSFSKSNATSMAGWCATWACRITPSLP